MSYLKATSTIKYYYQILSFKTSTSTKSNLVEEIQKKTLRPIFQQTQQF